MSELMRKQFEEWECDSSSGPQTDPMWLMRCAVNPDDYGILEVQRNWEAWRASRKAIDIRLPPAGSFACDPKVEAEIVSECAEVLTQQGIVFSPSPLS